MLPGGFLADVEPDLDVVPEGIGKRADPLGVLGGILVLRSFVIIS